MKFICPSCKAKYQIADEKVSGRSVRMKCRKCGFDIQISKPAAATGDAAEGEAASVPPPAAEPAPSPAPAARAAQAKSPAPARAAAPPPRAPLGSRPGAPPPRAPLGSRPSAPPPARPAPPARPIPAAPVAAQPSPARPAAPAAPERSSPAAATYDDTDEARTQFVGGGALAGALSAMLAAPASERLGTPAPARDSVLATSFEDWHVGINGVPVGPLRLSEIRSKAAVGAITPESLVWRPGFDEWKPLRSFPELMAVIDEALPSSPVAALGANGSNGAALASPAVLAPTTGAAVVSDTDDFAGLPQRGRSPAWAWVAVGMALLFGLTIGFVVFKDSPKEPIIKYVEVAGPGQPGTPAATASGGDTLPAASASDPGQKVARGGGPLPAKTTGDKPGDPPKSGLNLGGLDPGGTGPRPLGPAGEGPSSAAGGGGQLDSAQISSTVARYRTSVQRSCWQPALAARASDAASSARVSVSIAIGPTGSVQSVSSSGDPKGYPGLASCIVGRVRGWQFPASGGTTNTNVPFVFVAQ
ncbi:MAG: zinc-ribbon domain-containing protein [Polyangiaceae bacterium]|nr:zinc-ribbon domain-containing protein [Polyangiaceae bacterium]